MMKGSSFIIIIIIKVNTKKTVNCSLNSKCGQSKINLAKDDLLVISTALFKWVADDELTQHILELATFIQVLSVCIRK